MDRLVLAGVVVITDARALFYIGGISSRPQLIYRQPRECLSVIVLPNSPGGLTQLNCPLNG